MRIVLLGPPGAGKGSLALLLHTRLGFVHLSAGEIFRHEMARRSALGRRVKQYVTAGRLVPDALVVQVMTARLKRLKRSEGYILDGFPRTKNQAIGLDRALRARQQPLDAALYLTSPQWLLVQRLTGRRVCPRCGTNYHVRTMKPRRAGRCDQCGATLITRKDDQLQTIRNRLVIDQKSSRPLLTYYQQQGLLHRVNGIGHIEQALKRALVLFRKQGWLHDRA